MNPRQYAAEIPNVPGMEVWFQRATDVVRKLISGDIDIGIVGYDMLREIGNEDEDLVVGTSSRLLATKSLTRILNPRFL